MAHENLDPSKQGSPLSETLQSDREPVKIPMDFSHIPSSPDAPTITSAAFALVLSFVPASEL